MSKLSWSYSMFSCAMNCLKCFEQQYVSGKKPTGPESGDMAFGSALHSALNQTLTKGDGQSVFDIYWDSYQDKEEVEYGRFKWNELRVLGREFIRKFEKLHAPKYELHFAEERLFSEYNGIRLEGTPDFFGLYNGRASLRDFKTSGYNYEKERQHRALQLYLYAYLYRENKQPTRIDTLGYTVFNKGTGSIQDLTWEFDEAVMYNMLNDMTRYIKMFEGLLFSDTAIEIPRNPNAQRHSFNCFGEVLK